MQKQFWIYILLFSIDIKFLLNKEKKINLRADFGFNKDTSGIYFGMEEAF
jgi:hypothetical protein